MNYGILDHNVDTLSHKLESDMRTSREQKRDLRYLVLFSSRKRHTRSTGDWSTDVCSSDLLLAVPHFAWYLHSDRKMQVLATGDVRRDRKSVVQGKSVDLGGRRRIIKET